MKSTRPVAVITGAARGIGKGCALELARGGFNLLINDRPDADSVEKLHATQQECLAEGVEVICFPADVGDLSLHEEMLDAAQNQWGRLDCLLNNAGISVKKRGDLLDLEPDSFDQNIAINTRALSTPVAGTILNPLTLNQLAGFSFVLTNHTQGRVGHIWDILTKNSIDLLRMLAQMTRCQVSIPAYHFY